MRTKAIGILFGIGLAVGVIAGSGGVVAAPIDCPGAQVATKTADFWSCVNPADHENESGKDKNPNGHPNT
jgi:hypothetical protein